MKKSIKIMIGLLLSAVLVVTALGCPQDADTNDDTVPSTLHGTWKNSSLGWSTNVSAGFVSVRTLPGRNPVQNYYYKITGCSVNGQVIEIELENVETWTYTLSTDNASVYLSGGTAPSGNYDKA